MGKHTSKKFIFALTLLAAVMVIALPVCAVNGTISIAYRGSGGSYLGDTIIFDGHNSFGNVTVIQMSGPGLPAGGVPVYDLNGAIGSGNPIPVNPDGSWKFAWYSNSIRGSEKIQTARYYFTVYDLSSPDKTATTSVMLKKPEFYVTVSPSLASYGDYIQLTGLAEKGSSNVRFDISDASGKIVHAYDTTVSGSGYFNKGFHIDMPDGVYTVILSSPSTKTTYRGYLTVAPNSVIAAMKNASAPETGSSPVPTESPAVTTGNGSLSISSSPAGATVFLDSVMLGTTPLNLDTVPSGNHLVEIKAPGYVTSSVQVEVKPGDTVVINPILVKGSSPMPVSILTVITGTIISFVLVVAGAKRRRT
jgi:hypothetical protein